MQVFLSDSIESVPNEEQVLWLEDVSRMAYVREAFAITHNRQRRIPYGGNGRVGGYTQLFKDAPRQGKDIFDRPEFLRRVFYLTDGDRDSQPRGAYKHGWPMEAVDPLSVTPSVASQEPEDGNNEQIELTTIQLAVKNLAVTMAEEIAKNSDVFMHIEWRDLERVAAEVFEGLGFDVELTPPSKDGGKDIIAWCRVGGKKKTYYIEIKHWRSGKKVGRQDVINFIEVVMNESDVKGLILSSSGFNFDGYSIRSQIERKKIKLGDKEKIQTLCQNYVTTKSGIRFPTASLEKIVFEDTHYFR